MRVLIFHGYLLRGTGSNVYNAELAQALAGQGHDVHVLCQDREAELLGWVDAVGDWETGGMRVREVGDHGVGGGSGHRGEGGRQRGKITVYRPDIAGLLPVYVYDRYAGFEVKTYPDLTEIELESYIAMNVAAVREVVAAAGEIDAALANHLVMGPVILARAGLTFAAKVHGSDLSYTVRPHADRFVPYAREGMAAATAALVGSRHTAEDLWATVPLPGLREKTRLGPPGLDPAEFAPRGRTEADNRLRSLAAELEAVAVPGEEAAADGERRDTGKDEAGSFGRDPAAAAAALRWFAGAPGDRVIFVGKLLVNKGVDLLLAAWPLVVAEHPRARLLLAGFGGFEATLRALWRAIGSGDEEAALAIAAAAGEGSETRRLRLLEGFLGSPPAGYAEAGRAAAGSVRISGRLEHHEVAVAMAPASALVMPSTFPEAFGMVAAEAAASGVLPVSAAHSGMVEVSARLAEAIDPGLAWLLSFGLEPDPVRAIADRLNAWLGLDPALRADQSARLRNRSAELWSWDGAARSLLAASAGELENLPSPEPARGLYQVPRDSGAGKLQ